MIADPLSGAALSVRLRLLKENKGVHPAYLHRALALMATSAFCSSFNFYERAKYNTRIAAVSIEKAPVFIVGHWRSGTTFLHNLLALDGQLAYISLFQASFPNCFLTLAKIKPLLEKVLPTTRPMDGMSVGFDMPYEDEFAIANASPYSYYHALSFPNNAQIYFKKFVLFDDNDPTLSKAWQAIYLSFLKKVTYARLGKQLVLKNPVNTARIRLILELFPNAKFIHIYRNPYDVFASMLHTIRTLTDLMRLNKGGASDSDLFVFDHYKALMMRYFSDREQIPVHNLVEIRYEDLVVAPLDTLQRIYEHLNLGNFEAVKTPVQGYLDRNQFYRRNVFYLTKERILQIQKHWNFALNCWPYPEPQVGK